MLRKLSIPQFTERLYGITAPDHDKIYACDHDEAFEITLGSPTTVEVVGADPYQYIASFPNALGIPAGKPIHELAGTKVSYKFDGRNDFASVTIRRAGQTETLSFRTLSGDWFVATLSSCGRYLLLAEPYLIECYEFV